MAASRDYPPEVVRDAKLWVDEAGLYGRETKGEVVLVLILYILDNFDSHLLPRTLNGGPLFRRNRCENSLELF